jgi:hypothetical protein
MKMTKKMTSNKLWDKYDTMADMVIVFGSRAVTEATAAFFSEKDIEDLSKFLQHLEVENNGGR